MTRPKAPDFPVLQPGDLLTEQQVAEILAVPSTTLRKWRHRRIGPQWIKLGDSLRSPVRYPRGGIETYVDECRAATPEVRP